MTSDLIHDTVSAPTRDEAMLMLWRDQAARWEQQDNQSEQDWRRENDVVREEMVDV